MTELELYKYINDNDIEWNRQDNDGTPDVLILNTADNSEML